MLRREIEIVNELGLHARASAKLTQLAGSYNSEVWMARNGQRVNAKSIMGVMMLAAAQGTNIEFEVNGPDEQAAMDAIVKLISNKFEEGE